MSPKAGLTLGIEIEFLLIGRKDALNLVYTTADSTKPLTAIKQILQHRLPDVPFNAVSEDGHYENWTVTSDSSITLLSSKFAELPEDYFVQDVELISYVLSYHDDDWHGELEQILHVLHELFNTTEPSASSPTRPAAYTYTSGPTKARTTASPSAPSASSSR